MVESNVQVSCAFFIPFTFHSLLCSLFLVSYGHQICSASVFHILVLFPSFSIDLFTLVKLSTSM